MIFFTILGYHLRILHVPFKITALEKSSVTVSTINRGTSGENSRFVALPSVLPVTASRGDNQQRLAGYLLWFSAFCIPP